MTNNISELNSVLFGNYELPIPLLVDRVLPELDADSLCQLSRTDKTFYRFLCALRSPSFAFYTSCFPRSFSLHRRKKAKQPVSPFQIFAERYRFEKSLSSPPSRESIVHTYDFPIVQMQETGPLRWRLEDRPIDHSTYIHMASGNEVEWTECEYIPSFRACCSVNNLLYSSDGACVTVERLSATRPDSRTLAERSGVVCLAIAGVLLIGGTSLGNIHIWSRSTAKRLATFEHHEDRTVKTLLPHGKLLFTADDGIEIAPEEDEGDEDSLDEDWPDQPQLLEKDSIIKIYNLKHLKEVGEIHPECGPISSLAADVNRLFACARNHVEVWNFTGETPSRLEILDMPLAPGYPPSLQVYKDWLFASSGSTLKVWKLDSLNEIANLNGHAPISCFQVFKNKISIATEDGKVSTRHVE